MVDIKDNSQHTTNDKNAQAILINGNAAVTTISTSRVLKTLKSHDGKISRSTTVSSRTITRTNKSIDADIHPSDFAGMNSSAVVPAGSGSSPRVDSFVSNLDAHGVFGINAFNALPTHSDLIKWISDSDSLIKEFDLWSVQNQIAQNCCESTPGCCDYASMKVASEESLNNHNCDNNVGNESGKNAAAGPEDIKVTHAPILSQKVEASHV